MLVRFSVIELIKTTSSEGKKFSPANAVPGGMTPRERGKQKKEKVLIWLLKWHFSTAAMVARCCDVEINYMRILEKKGLVEPFNTPTLQSKHGWMLTKDGHSAANSALGQCLDYDCDAASIDRSNLRHDLCCQYATSYLKAVNFLPERLIGMKDKKDVKRPDAFIVDADGKKIALELELTPKKRGREFDRAIVAAANLIHSKKVDEVIYVTDSKALKTRYETDIKKVMGHWERDPKTRQWKMESQFHFSDEQIANIKFLLIPDLQKGL